MHKLMQQCPFVIQLFFDPWEKFLTHFLSQSMKQENNKPL